MIKVRLLKERNSSVYRLVDSVDLPNIESVNELNGLALGIGQLLGKYQDLIQDPVIVSSLVDTSIEDWTIMDFESVQAILRKIGMRLLITIEDQLDEPTKLGDVVYLMVDTSNKHLGILDHSIYTVIKDNPQSIDLPGIIKQLVTGDYFNQNKFKSNPIKELCDSLTESKELIGAYNGNSLNTLFKLLSDLNKELVTIVID